MHIQEESLYPIDKGWNKEHHFQSMDKWAYQNHVPSLFSIPYVRLMLTPLYIEINQQWKKVTIKLQLPRKVRFVVPLIYYSPFSIEILSNLIFPSLLLEKYFNRSAFATIIIINECYNGVIGVARERDFKLLMFSKLPTLFLL